MKRTVSLSLALLICATVTAIFFFNRAHAATTYTWNQTGTASWALDTNWTPARTTPAADDVLVFNNAATTTVTNVPTQTIGQLSVSGNTTVNLQGNAAATVLTIGGGAGTDLSVASGSALNINVATNTTTITLAAGATGSISGNMTFSTAAHKLDAVDANAITFNSGAILTQAAGCTGNIFTAAGTANAVVFASGSTFTQQAGANPFGLTAPASKVVFQSGSLFSFQQNALPGFSGRTYANLDINFATYSQTSVGGGAFVIDNLTVTLGVVHLQLTNVTIKGNISVAASQTLDFNPAAAAAIGLAGTSAQTITNNGTLTFNANANITVSNTNGVTLNSAVTLPGTNTVNAGATLATAATLTNSGTTNVNGNFQINQGGFASGNNFVYNAATGMLVFNNSAGSFAVTGTPVFWPAASGPQNVNVQGGGGITMSVARTVGALFQYAAGVSGAGNLTLTGTTQVNTGGFTSGSPTYGGVSSLLKYNTGGTYARNGEWLPGAISGAGYPTHVQLSNNTALDLVNGSNSPYQMAGDLTIDTGSTMQLSLSTLTNPLTIFGSVNNNGTFTLSNSAGGDVNVGGSWNNNGTFNNNSRTVNLNGSIGQSISGNSTFFNLTKNTAVAQTLTFAAGSTQTITNLLTLNGAAGNLLSLRSNTPGTQWKINAPGTQSVNFVDVKDSDASGGTIITAGTSVDSGNNINWSFGAAADYNVTVSGPAIVVDDVSGNNDTLTVSQPGAGQIKFAAPGRFFVVNGGAPINGDSGNLLIPTNSITINAGGGDDIITVGGFGGTLPSLAINGGTGNDTVNFNGNLTFDPVRDLSVDFLSSGVPVNETVNFAGGANVVLATTGPASVKASRTITFAAASRLQVADGTLTLEGNRQVTPTVGDFNGIDINGGQVLSVGSGNVFIKGTGGAGDFIENAGVQVSNSGKVRANAAGTLDVQGQGGNASGGSVGAGTGNIGVYLTLGGEISSASSAINVAGTGGTTVGVDNLPTIVGGNNVMGVGADELGLFQTEGAGQLTITGTGGIVGAGDGSSGFVNSGGIFITAGDVNGDGGSVKSTGIGANAGAIVMQGTAQNGGNGAAQGVRVDNPGTVTTVDGPITITGTSAICSNACLGTSIRGPVSASGTGAINITGTGGTTNGAFPTNGVNVRSGGNVAANNGNITITATAGSGSSTPDNLAFRLAPAGTGILQTVGTGSIILIADSMNLGTPSATISAGINSVTLRPNTNGLAINLGSALDPTGGPLSFSDPELDRIVTAATINIGDSNSGAITVSAPITRPAASNLVLTSGANIDLPSSLNSNNGNVSLLPTTNNFPSGNGTDVTTSATKTLTLAAFKNLTISISSTTVDTGYTQLNVAGLVNLNNAQLALSGPYVPVGGETFIIVNNDSNDAISGTFNSLPEGTLIVNFLGSGRTAKISYVGGDGNDAVLSVIPCPSSFTVNDNGDAGDAVNGDGVCATAGAVCTLRAAIQEANASAGSCGPVNINFNIGSATITVASELFISHDVNINGPTANSVTVAATPAAPTRVFRVTTPVVSFSNLTVTGARSNGSGGGLLVQSGVTTALNMLFTGNTVVNGSGGGAGVAAGTLNIYNSTISGNTATNGGGLYNGGGTLNLVNDTITANNANGDVGTGPCGVPGEGGGLDVGLAATNVRNTIVAGNTACNAGIPNISGTINDQGNNLTSGNPLLGPLQNNGGPSFTHALLSLSPATDAGNDCVLTNTCVPALGFNITTDQRGPGFPRSASGSAAPQHVDIGAFERQSPSAADSTVTGRIVDSSGDPVAGAAVRMRGTQNRLVMTDSEGNYRFDEVETAGFYTVTPTRPNFSFAPVERSFSQLGQRTEALFIASATSGSVNPSDATEYFVRQQYLDFLGREPDEAGLNFWVNNIASCGADANCLAAKRIDTSAAFFLSIEFQQTGYLVYRTYQSAYGEIPGAPVPLRLGEFKPDTARIGNGVIVNHTGWQGVLEANKQSYMAEFVQRARFVAAYPGTMAPSEFVDKLFQNAGVMPAGDDRAAAINEFGSAATSADAIARGRALRRVAENSALERQQSNKAFVLMQYFGYLGRDANSGPDADFSGYSFWLEKLNSFNGDFRDAEMVKAFLVSGEYRRRFPR